MNHSDRRDLSGTAITDLIFEDLVRLIGLEETETLDFKGQPSETDLKAVEADKEWKVRAWRLPV